MQGSWLGSDIVFCQQCGIGGLHLCLLRSLWKVQDSLRSLFYSLNLSTGPGLCPITLDATQPSPTHLWESSQAPAGRWRALPNPRLGTENGLTCNWQALCCLSAKKSRFNITDGTCIVIQFLEGCLNFVIFCVSFFKTVQFIKKADKRIMKTAFLLQKGTASRMDAVRKTSWLRKIAHE